MRSVDYTVRQVLKVDLCKLAFLLTMQTWPPCNEDKLRKFRWDTVQPTTGSQLVSTELSSHFSLQQPEQRSSSDFNSEGLRSAYTEDAAATPSIGSPPSQGQTSFAGLHTSGAHLY